MLRREVFHLVLVGQREVPELLPAGPEIVGNQESAPSPLLALCIVELQLPQPNGALDEAPAFQVREQSGLNPPQLLLVEALLPTPREDG